MKMHKFTPQSFTQIPEKKRGRHRFIAIASYVVSHESAAKSVSGEEQMILDQENLWDLSIGCIDCERPYDKYLKNYCDAPEYKDARYGN